MVPFVIDALERINLDLGLVAKMFVIVYVVELSDSVKDSFKLSRKESIQYIRDAILTIFFELVNYLRRDPLAFKNKEKLKKRLSRVISRRS